MKLSDITITIPDYQKKLFTSAYKLLKPNGTLVYSTCTVMYLKTLSAIIIKIKIINE
jgi:hypothetical protein